MTIYQVGILMIFHSIASFPTKTYPIITSMMGNMSLQGWYYNGYPWFTLTMNIIQHEGFAIHGSSNHI